MTADHDQIWDWIEGIRERLDEIERRQRWLVALALMRHQPIGLKQALILARTLDLDKLEDLLMRGVMPDEIKRELNL